MDRSANTENITISIPIESGSFLRKITDMTGLTIEEYINALIIAVRDLPSAERKHLCTLYAKEAKREETTAEDHCNEVSDFVNLSNYKAQAFKQFSEIMDIANRSRYNNMSDVISGTK